jgi:hypothetical protein
VNIDLTALTIAQLLGVLLVTAAIDTLSGIFGSIQAGTFDVNVVANFLETHVLKRVFPILGLGAISQALGTSGPGAAVWALALLGLGAYVAETVASISSNINPTPTA